MSADAKAGGTAAGARRLRRSDRREQILGAASTAFAAQGFAATSLDDVADAAGISRAILYRHFESKADLYRAALHRARTRLATMVGEPEYDESIVDALLKGASNDPDGFRLLFTHAAREPQFRTEMDEFHRYMQSVARDHLSKTIRNPAWADWAAHLMPVVTIAAITAWLDVGQPEPDAASSRIRAALTGILDVAQHEQSD